MKILITGSAGNLGSHLKSICERRGYAFECATRSNMSEINELMRGCDTVVHAAGDVKHSITEKLVDVTESNLLLTTRVLEACGKNSVSRFLYISSCAVYGDASHSHESENCRPTSINGKFKKLNEDLVISFCSARGISPTVFRPFNMYGGNDRFSVLSHMKRCHETNECFELLNDGVSRRDFIHVRDVAEVVIRCLIESRLPIFLNVGTGKTTSVREILEVFSAVCPNIKVGHRTVDEVEYSRADTTRLKRILGDYQFRNVLDDVANLRF